MDLQESIDRFGSPLTGLLVSWGVPAFDAAELAQDSLADAYLSLTSCRGDVNDPLVFGRWLRGIAKNKFRAWSRSRSRSRSRRQRFASAEPESLDRIAAETIVIDERLLRLRHEIERLPNKHREVVMMHYLDETPVIEVAALLSISVKAAEGRLYQARKKLRTQMDEPTTWNQVAKAVLL